MNLQHAELVAPDAIVKALHDVPGVEEIVKQMSEDPRPPPEEIDQSSRAWLKWCRFQKNRLQVVERDVPDGVLPDGIKSSLIDVKVGGKKREPDDAMYNRCRDLRVKVARGNTVWYVNGDGRGVRHDTVVFALRKFTGGMGDEDQDQPENDRVWKDYFLGPFPETRRVVCTLKANGEAAHLSARHLGPGRGFVLFAGSKNVHLALRRREDVDKYAESRYQVARTVASSVMDALEAVAPDRLPLFLSWLHHRRCTAVFEVLQPDHQHVVSLSHLPSPQLRFVAFAGPPDVETSYCAVAPETGFHWCGWLGLPSVDHATLAPDEVPARMDAVRRGYGYEGEVLYFVDGGDRVIGLLKKKTAWYVLSRAVREQVANAVHLRTKFGKDPDPDRLPRRLAAIRDWLGFSPACLDRWTALGVAFMTWTLSQLRSREPSPVDVRTEFPVLWRQFLLECDLSDRIPW